MTQRINIFTTWAHICSFSVAAERSDGGQTDVNINTKFVFLSPRADTEPSVRHDDFVNRKQAVKDFFFFFFTMISGTFSLFGNDSRRDFLFFFSINFYLFKQKRHISHPVVMRCWYCSQWERPRQKKRTVVGTNAGGNNWIFIYFTL